MVVHMLDKFILWPLLYIFILLINKVIYINRSVINIKCKYIVPVYVGFLSLKLNSSFMIKGKDVCLPGSAQCKGNMMYMCDVNGNWVTTDCPNNTSCLLSNGTISCGLINNKENKDNSDKQNKDNKKEEDQSGKKDKEDKDKRKDKDNKKEEDQSGKKDKDNKKEKNKEDKKDKKNKTNKSSGRKASGLLNDDSHDSSTSSPTNRKKPKPSEDNDSVKTIVTVKTVYLDESDTRDDIKRKNKKRGNKRMAEDDGEEKTTMSQRKNKKILVEKDLINGSNKVDGKKSVNTKQATRVDPILSIPIVIPKSMLGQNGIQPNLVSQQDSQPAPISPPNTPQQSQPQPQIQPNLTPSQQQQSQPQAAPSQQQQPQAQPQAQPAPAQATPSTPQPAQAQSQPSTAPNPPSPQQPAQPTPIPAAASASSPDQSAGAGQPAAAPSTPSPTPSGGGDTPKPDAGGASTPAEPAKSPESPTPSAPSGNGQKSDKKDDATKSTTETGGKDDKSKSSKDASSGGEGGGNLGITASKIDEIVKKCQLQAKKEYLEPVAKGISEGFKSKDMAAMFLAQIIHESGGLAHIEEIECAKDPGKCAANYDDKKGAPGKSYHGRGFMQLSWSANYKDASKGIGMGDKLWANPELVAKDPNIGIKVSVWFWKQRVEPKLDKSNLKFGESTKAINGALECKGQNVDKSKKRYKYYLVVADGLGITKKASEAGCY